MTTANDKIEKFAQLIEKYEEQHGKFDAAACLRCIEIARQEMKAGKYSEESFLKTKNILLSAVRCEGFYSN